MMCNIKDKKRRWAFLERSSLSHMSTMSLPIFGFFLFTSHGFWEFSARILTFYRSISLLLLFSNLKASDYKIYNVTPLFYWWGSDFFQKSGEPIMEPIKRKARTKSKALDFCFSGIISHHTLILHLLQLKSKDTNKYNSKDMLFWNQPFWDPFLKDYWRKKVRFKMRT